MPRNRKKLIRVLIIDDNPDDYDILCDLLSRDLYARFKIEWAQTFSQAKQSIEQEKHDVYLVDYYLDQESGLKLLSEYSQTHPMLLLTSRSSYDLDVEAMKAGAAGYLIKGQITRELLERSIRHAMERKETEKNLRKVSEQLQRQRDIFQMFLNASVALERSSDINDLFQNALLQLHELFPEYRFGMILDGSRPEISESVAFWGFEEQEQQEILQHRKTLLEVPVFNGKSVQSFVMPLPGQQGAIGKLILQGPEISHECLEAIGLFLKQVSAICDNKFLIKELEKLSNLDELTGAYNHYFFSNELKQVTETSLRFPTLVFSGVVVEVNRLEKVNDVFGNDAGAQMIQKAGELLRVCCRKSDIIAHIGGGQFCILCPATSSQGVTSLTKRISDSEKRYFVQCALNNDKSVTVPISVSLGFGSSDETSSEEVMQIAEERMRFQKHRFHVQKPILKLPEAFPPSQPQIQQGSHA